jgi:hypothetical protein
MRRASSKVSTFAISACCCVSRKCETYTFCVGSLPYTATVGFYRDGRIGELFIDCAKTGTDASVSARDAAIAASMALQMGGTVPEIRSAFTRRADGVAEGPLGKILDLLTEHETARLVAAE